MPDKSRGKGQRNALQNNHRIINETIEGLSLRSVARRVGVSHTAPYNHFADKQELLAAISTVGHEKLYQKLLISFEESKHSSLMSSLKLLGHILNLHLLIRACLN